MRAFSSFNRFPVVGLCALLLAGGAVVKANDDVAIRAVLAKNYARFTEAFQKRDADAMSKMMTDDYTAIGPDGSKAPKDHVLADLIDIQVIRLTL